MWKHGIFINKISVSKRRQGIIVKFLKVVHFKLIKTENKAVFFFFQTSHFF